METVKINLIDVGKCSCVSGHNNLGAQKSLDEYTNNTLNITMFNTEELSKDVINSSLF